MKSNKTILCWAGTIALVIMGCGKSEEPTPVAKESGRAVPESPKPEVKPTEPVTNAVPTQPANAVIPASDTAKDAEKATAEKAASPAQTTEPTNAAPASAAAADAKAQASGSATVMGVLSQDQMVQGLQAALSKGLEHAVASLGHDGGFLTNLNVKIPMPEKLQKVETTLRAMKQDKLADDFVITMNHAAELAVPEAGAVFASALSQMNIEDAKLILSGPNDAATQYFQKTTSSNLFAKFYPIVQKATEKAGVTGAYKNLVQKADATKSLGALGSAISGSLLDKDSMDVDAYVTKKAMEGLFKMVAEEENRIRQSPAARTTDILQKVFGAVKK